MKMNKRTAFGISFGIAATAAVVASQAVNTARAASANATASQVVTAAISIAKDSDLDFGTAIQGAALKTVAPGAAENADNASFTVSGQPSTAYTITLPADGTVTMATAGGGTADKEIAVSGFASFPATTGMIAAGGSQALYVGATRAALGATQLPGSYTATFAVSVVY